MTAARDGSADSVENHNNCGGIATDKSSAQTAAAAAAAVAAAATVAVAVAENDIPASVPMPLPLLPARTKGGYQHCSDCIHCASKGPLLSSPACLDLQAKTTKLQAVVGVFLPLLPYFLCVLFCRPHFFKLPSIRSVETNATRPALFQLWSGGSVAQHATKLWGATLACRAAARWSKDSSTRRQARCANIRQGKKAKTCLPRRRSPMSDANPKVQKPRHTRRTSTAGTLTLFCAVAVLLLDSTATATTTITTTTTIATAFECPVGVRLALTPALYKQGRDAFKCATYIPNYAFCQDSETGCSPPGPLDGSWVAVTGVDSVVLKDMMYLESIGLAAFKQFGGSIELSGDLRALQKIGDEAFYKAPNGGGSLNIDLSGAQSLRTIGGQFFGQFQIGSITADGLFPKFQGCFQFKDSNSGQLAVIPPNAVVLTPALYKQGYNVYKDATCILEMGFYNRDDPITDKVVLEDLGQLTGIGENAFGNHGFKGTIIFQGKFPKLTTIGRYAFINKPQPTSLIDLKGADFPLLEIIPEYAFGSFSGTIRISGRFASLKEIGRSAFGGAGNADSFINLGGLPALTSVGLFAFDAFEGLLTIDCDDCELLTEIDGYAFRSVSNAASRISFTGLAQLQKIGEYAFQNYKGILNLQFDAIDHFNSFAVGINAFSGTSNTKSGVQLPYDFALLEDALEKDGFGGYVFIGNGTSTTSTTTTRTSTTATTTTTTTYPAGSECSVADNFRYSAAAAIDNTFCTDEPNICRFQCCAFNVTDTCRACDADTGSCYDHLQLSPAGAAIAAETTSTWQDTPLFSGKRYSPPRITLEDENCAVFRGSRCYPLTSSGASDIRFQLMWGTPSNADDDKFNYVGGPPPLGLSKPGEGQDDPGGVSVINALTGDISASPLRNGSYTLWLLVYDSAAVDPDEGSRPLGIPQVFDQAVFARWDFEVQPTPEFNLQKGSSRTRVGPEITDPTTIDGNTTFYAVGGTYKIAPLEVLQTTTFSTVGGTLDSLRYALNGSLPDGLFVKTTSGDILVTFDPSNEGETYTVDLDVIDGSKRRNLERMTMPVKYRDIDDPDNVAEFGPNKTACAHGVPFDDINEFDGQYACDCSGTLFEGSNCQVPMQQVLNCEDGSALVDGECAFFDLKIDKQNRAKNAKNGTSDYTDPIAMQDTFYEVGVSYRVAPFEILTTTVQSDSTGDLADITYTLSAGSPDSFFLSTTSGELFWRFGPQDSGAEYNITLFAVDKAGARQEMETMRMRALFNDLDVLSYGPNNQGCKNGAPVDGDKFDQSFTCDCGSTSFAGETCSEIGPHEQECFNNGKVVDTIPFDGVYTCDCEGTGFLGDNCGKSRADAMMAESAEKSKKLIAVVVSSGSGLIFILGAVVYVCCKKRIAKKDALLALDTARKAYGLAPARQSQAPNRTVESVTNPAFVGITLTDGAAIGEASAALHSTDDEYGDFTAAVQAAAGVSTAPAPPPVPGTNSKFVAPTINLGDSLLAAKGLDVLLGIDPKTYMHARNKVKVIISEFAKRGTDEDRQNIVGLLDGTYVNPPDSGSGKVDSRERSCKEIMATSPAVEMAGLELHHVLALRLYTTSTYKSINNPMRQTPPELPHPFAATMYYISDALSKLREVQGKDPKMRNTQLVFWRGMQNLQMTEEFARTGGTEMACMSTTSSMDVAAEFAESESPLLFKFVSNSFMSHGADISFLSVYPGEKEVLYPPLTYLRPIRMSKKRIGGRVYDVVEVEPVFPK